MTEKVIDTVNTYSLFEKSRNVTVALSGGADSVSLLVCLLEIRNIYNLNITAAHFNHCLRGEESDRDEAFVRKLCENLGVELFCKSMDVAKYAKEQKLSIELAARKARYAFFEEINNGVVATAHTADDNLETVIFNIARGTAIKGLCGIPVQRDIYIRPLLFCTREDVEKYLKSKNIDFVTDSTNLSDDYSRNKIRHNVVPTLKEINKNAAEKAAQMSSLLRIDEDYLEKAAMTEFNKRYTDNKLNVENFELLHTAISSRVIIYFLNRNKIEANALHINRVLQFVSHTAGELSLPGGKIVKSGNFLQSFESFNEIPDFNIEIIEKNSGFLNNFDKINSLLLKNCIDCDKIVGSIKLRKRISGDKITLPKRHVTKTLKKLFTELKVPTVFRDNLPVISDDNGVIWVYGIGVDKRVMADKNTEKILFVKTEKEVSMLE